MRAFEAVNREWPVAVEIRKLQSRLWRLAQKQEKAVFLVTSAIGGEGKTTTTAYLAATLASHKDRRILVLDFDLRRPTMHEHFGLKSGPGVSDVLAGSAALDQAIQQTEQSGLDVLCSGDAEESPSGLLDSPRVGEIVEEVRSRYDMILLDSPPVVPVADTSALIPVVDGVLLVVMAGKTPRPLLAKARELILGMGGTIAGLVVGNAQEASPDSYRDSYYYSYTSKRKPSRD